MVVRQSITIPSQLQLIDRLHHHIYLSSSLIFVSGEQGSGKSALLEQLSNGLPNNIQESFILLNEQLTESQIRQQTIMQLYHAPLFDDQDTLFSSIELLEEKENNSAPRLIIFDNAEYLSITLLVELTELIANKNRLGDNEINILLLSDASNSRKMIDVADERCHCLEFKLEPLSNNEAQSLLNHIFQQENYTHKMQHNDALLKKLSECQGNPQKIAELADQVVSGKVKIGKSYFFSGCLPALAIMITLLVIAGLLVNYLYPILISQDNGLFKNSTAVKTIVKSVENKTITIEKKEKLMAEQLAANWEEKPSSEIQDNKMEVGKADKANVVPKLVVDTPEKKVIQLSEKHKKQTIAPVQTDTKVEVAAQRRINSIESTKVSSAAVIKKTVKEKEQDNLLTKTERLLAIPAERYTLQLSGMESRQSVEKFIAQYGPAKGQLHIYLTERNGKPWYVVIYGEYKSWGEATRAGKNLPGALANLDNWIKKYRVVHQDLQSN